MTTTFSVPQDYRPLLRPRETEHAIKRLKDFVELNLATELNLSRVTAPLFVRSGTGINDDLNGIEQPVSFPIRGLAGERAEIVQSLAKWKRLQLAELAFELSSMGIRVDKPTLLRQLELRGCKERCQLYWHRKLLSDEMPLSIGGGIGQSRLCMYFLRKAHIGEIQASLWPDEMRATCNWQNIPLL